MNLLSYDEMKLLILNYCKPLELEIEEFEDPYFAKYYEKKVSTQLQEKKLVYLPESYVQDIMGKKTDSDGNKSWIDGVPNISIVNYHIATATKKTSERNNITTFYLQFTDFTFDYYRILKQGSFRNQSLDQLVIQPLVRIVQGMNTKMTAFNALENSMYVYSDELENYFLKPDIRVIHS